MGNEAKAQGEEGTRLRTLRYKYVEGKHEGMKKN
jgi:hypothetical protein